MSGQFNLDDQSIISALGIESSSEDFQKRTLTRIGELLDEKMAVRIESLLTDEELVQAAAVGDDPEKFVAFIQEHVPNTDELVRSELAAIVEQLKSYLS